MSKNSCRIPLRVEDETSIKMKVREVPKVGLSVEEQLVMGGGTSDYNELLNHPTINEVEVVGDKTGPDYNLQNKLTAGQNITLNGTIISADVDLEYASYMEVMAFLNM